MIQCAAATEQHLLPYFLGGLLVLIYYPILFILAGKTHKIEDVGFILILLNAD